MSEHAYIQAFLMNLVSVDTLTIHGGPRQQGIHAAIDMFRRRKDRIIEPLIEELCDNLMTGEYTQRHLMTRALEKQQLVLRVHMILLRL